MSATRGYTVEMRGEDWYVISPAGNALFGPFTIQQALYQALHAAELLNHYPNEERGRNEQTAREHLTPGREPSADGGCGFGHAHRHPFERP